jgi:hypothetical protein
MTICNNNAKQPKKLIIKKHQSSEVLGTLRVTSTLELTPTIHQEGII